MHHATHVFALVRTLLASGFLFALSQSSRQNRLIFASVTKLPSVYLPPKNDDTVMPTGVNWHLLQEYH